MNTYLSLQNKHEGEKCFIIGAGPSLWFHMHQSFFSNIHQLGKTITVNSSVLADPNFDYWISNDSLCRGWSWWEDVKKGKGTKIVRSSWEKYRRELDGFLFFEPRPTPEDTINPDDAGLCYPCSVSSAIDLGIQCGFKKIFIFGLDHQTIQGKHHFWQFFPKDKQPTQLKPAQGSWQQQKSVFPIHLESYKALKLFAEYKGAKIYNCNLASNVDVFEKVGMEKLDELENILNEIN